MNSSWAKADAIYWSSAIFSRPAMRVNHVMTHRYGERKALGVYRVIAAILMTTMTAFLTVYEVTVSESRPWLTMVWWVSLGTTIFFMITLTSFADYFSDKVPDPKRALDGASPFYSWKVSSFLFSFFFQASVHLVLLERLNAPYFVEPNYVEDIIAFAPLTLLLADFAANRFYIPLTINTAYCTVFYALAALAYLLLEEVEKLVRLPELRFLELQSNKELGLLIPLFVMAGAYALQRIKFWYLSDGDLQFDFHAWAKEAQDRMEWIEDDGAREEEIFRFNVENDRENPKNAAQRRG